MKNVLALVVSLVCGSVFAQDGYPAGSLTVREGYSLQTKTSVTETKLVAGSDLSAFDILVLFKDDTALCYSGSPMAAMAVLNSVILEANAQLPKSYYDIVNVYDYDISCAKGSDKALSLQLTTIKGDTKTFDKVRPCNRKCR